MKKIIVNLINAERREKGFQKGMDFVLRTAEKEEEGIKWFYFVSREMHEEVRLSFRQMRGKTYFVFPEKPEHSSEGAAQKRIKELEKEIGADAVYTPIAPSPYKFSCPEVMEFDGLVDTAEALARIKSVGFIEKMKLSMKDGKVKSALKRAAAIIVPSETIARSVKSATGCSQVEVVDATLPKSMVGETPTPTRHGGINILYVTNNDEYNNVLLVPEVARILVRDYDLDDINIFTTLTVDTPQAELLKDRIKEENVRNHVTNIGYQQQEERIKLYNRCDMAFTPCLVDSFPHLLIEYMKFNLPVVAAGLPFNSDILDEAALYFDPYKAVDAAEKIYEVFSKPDVKERLLQKAAERMERYTDFEGGFKKKCEILKKV